MRPRGKAGEVAPDAGDIGQWDTRLGEAVGVELFSVGTPDGRGSVDLVDSWRGIRIIQLHSNSTVRTNGDLGALGNRDRVHHLAVAPLDWNAEGNDRVLDAVAHHTMNRRVKAEELVHKLVEVAEALKTLAVGERLVSALCW